MENFFDNADAREMYAEVWLPIAVMRSFTYSLPASWAAQAVPGMRVLVPLGATKIETGVIRDIHFTKPDFATKSAIELLDNEKTMLPLQMEFMEWMADYYLCTPGEVLKAALPTGLKLSSKTFLHLHPDFYFLHADTVFPDIESTLLERLKKKPLTYDDAAKLLVNRQPHKTIKNLLQKNAVVLQENVEEKYKLKKEKRIRLTDAYTQKAALEALFQQLAKHPKQEEIILYYLQETDTLHNTGNNKAGLLKKQLLEQYSVSALQHLLKNKILEEFSIATTYFESAPEIKPIAIQLSEQQLAARQALETCWQEKSVAVLFGVTGSGKTEIYMDLISRTLQSGSQALLLLPEIALTTQIVQRLKSYFGNEMGVYHSRFSDNERVEVYHAVRQGKIKFIVGVRSSLFLPFDNLGLLIVDEEHDTSYKQQDPAPRYHARDAAIVLAQKHHAKLILGSASPSLESYYNAQTKKFGWVELTERYGNAVLPDVTLLDIKAEKQKNRMKGELSVSLLDAIKKCVDDDHQAILFQNRRGYSPIVQCATCGWIPKCIHCSVSLTYHQYRNQLLCHYCGYHESIPKKCPDCTSPDVLSQGYGTEKLEEELTLHFPDTEIVRMDVDTTRSKKSYETILDDISSGRAKIVVGTQMVTKGLDFNKVQVVGIFDADRMIHFPDFRSHERAFQLMIQVSGRAGRREQRGLVLIQTKKPDHPLFDFVLRHDVAGFMQQHLSDRLTHYFPPIVRLIEISLSHKDKKKSWQTAQALVFFLQHKKLGVEISGPGEPMVSKIKNEYWHNLFIKIPKNINLSDVKQKLAQALQEFFHQADTRTVRYVVDVDPM